MSQTPGHSPSSGFNAPTSKTSSRPTTSLHLRTSIISAFGLSAKRQRHSDSQTPIPSDIRPTQQIGTAAITCDALGRNAGRPNRKSSFGLSKLGRALLGGRTKESHAPPEHPEQIKYGKDDTTGLAAWRPATSIECGREAGNGTFGNIAGAFLHTGHESRASSPNDYEERPWELGFVGGAAARAAAAAQNGTLEPNRQVLPQEMSRLLDLRLTCDSESGIGIELREQPDDLVSAEAEVVRRDPANILPSEIFTHILLYLDAYSTMQAELVSHRWNASASTCHVWRSIFVGDYGRAPHPRYNSTSGRVGGLGFGLHRPVQEWKEMWKARKALQVRWSQGHAAAAYLEGHQDTVYCVQFDEYKILTGSRDRTIRIWDATTFECLRILGVAKQTGSIQATPSLPPRSSKGHQPFDVINPRLPSRSLRYPTAEDVPIYHHGSILCLQFDDDLMVTGSSDTTLIMWDIRADWKPSQRLRQHRAGVLDVCFNAKCMVSCSKDTTICLWDRSTGTLLRVLAGHRGPVNAVQLRGDLIVSASGDGVAKLWNAASGLCVKEFPSRDRGLACVEFSPDCRTIFAGGNDQMIYQFDASNGELVRELRGHSHLVRSLHLDHLNGRVISGSYDKSIKVYNAHSGEMICDFGCWTTSWILSAKSDYRRIIATSQDKRVVVIDFGHDLRSVDLLHGLEQSRRKVLS